jgi:hypothetical protein
MVAGTGTAASFAGAIQLISGTIALGMEIAVTFPLVVTAPGTFLLQIQTLSAAAATGPQGPAVYTAIRVA